MGLGDTAAVKDLVKLPRSNLRDMALEAGATDGQVEKADADEHDPKAALAKLIILHRRIQQSPPPPYWTETAGTFHNVVRSAYVQSMAHDLLNKTAVDKGTADRKKLGKPPPPGGFEIVAAQRIENSAMWERYAKKIVEIQRQGTTKTAINVKTTAHLSDQSRATLTSSVNEVYLFHGTSIEAAKGIAETGFRIDLAGSKAGKAFGAGAYFAERSTKSDEYTTPHAHTLGIVSETHYAMILCRVCLGEVYRIEDFDTAAERHVLGSDTYNSLLGDREAARDTFREFIVYDEDQVTAASLTPSRDQQARGRYRPASLTLKRVCDSAFHNGC